MKFRSLFTSNKPIIGMIHLPALPGYANHPGMSKVLQKALTDLETLEKAGFDGALVENDNDQPHQIEVNNAIKEAFRKVMSALIKQAKIPVGMEIIYDMLATIQIAHEVNASFVRLDVFVDDVQTKWGKIYASYKEVSTLLKELRANDLVLLTDIHVKHAQMLNDKTLKMSAKEAIQAGSDAIIITGRWTGIAPHISDFEMVKGVSKKIPVLIGSGFNSNNAKTLLEVADGAIVGTSVKKGANIDYKKAVFLANLIKKLD